MALPSWLLHQFNYQLRLWITSMSRSVFSYWESEMNRAVLSIGLSFVVLSSGFVSAVNPGSVSEGKRLFELDWPVSMGILGGDGLGPLFNNSSCVACHHQGGIGGSGDARFNAQALGIESMQFSNPVTKPEELVSFLRSFYPAFVQADGSTMPTAALPHFSARSNYQELRNRLLSATLVRPSDQGGHRDVEDMRRAIDSPIIFSERVSGNQMSLRARVFQRNTTPLFGAGMIDAVPVDALRQQVKLQERHSEISGRLSILNDGSVGRFGWRANASHLVNFVDRACANELGLNTKRRQQMTDPTRPEYQNQTVDISDEQIKAMTFFIGSLPAPVEKMPRDPGKLALVKRGKQVFESVGCAVCHTPTLGPATGLYSDLLLHDMGPYLYDFDAAEPYVIKQNVSYERDRVVPGTSRVSGYYGAPQPLPGEPYRGHKYISPRGSLKTRDYVTSDIRSEMRTASIATGRGRTLEVQVRDEVGIYRRLKPSNTTQEWRTPPLWGLRDSAPYMHDGRAETVLEAISIHDGESAGTRDRFLQLPINDRHAVLEFLDTLVAPPNVPKATNL